MLELSVVNIAKKFTLFSDPWNPRIIGDLNDSHIKAAKLHGQFIWHNHQEEDELFLVIKGTLRMLYREGELEREITINPGEFVVVPKGVEHLPIATSEVHVLLIEPKSTVNTGNVEDEHTRHTLDRI